MAVEIGQRLSHYQILDKLGEGGMGVVYKALDTSLNRNVALKFLPPHLTSDASLRKRFINEAQAASALDHPNICTIHEINKTEDDQLYICMAYYEGESLSQKIKKEPLQYDESMKIFGQVAQGLIAAHQAKIIHRDIKPGNIIITEKGEAKIVDFGLATLAGEKITESVSTKGTIAYMAPEIIRGQSGDHRADIWSLGVVLFEMLTGNLPFKGDYPEPLMYTIVNEEPETLSQYLTNIPESLQKVLDKLLKKDPEERYQSIQEMLVDLKQFVKDTEFIAIKTGFTIKRLFLRKRNYVYGITALVLAIIIFLTVGKSFLFPERNLQNSIAVLPLENIINDDEQEWFTDGMTDELITNLAQLNQLKVISRSSSMKYKRTTKNPSIIGEELGVSYLVDGTVVRSGDSVKISARLINAREDKYIWAKEYERRFTNILELHHEIAKAIVEQINIQLTPQENLLLTKSRTVNTETYELYMKGMYHINKLTPNGITKGLSYLLKAVESNPEEPLAYAGLAIAYLIISHGGSYTQDILEKAQTATLNALKLDNDSPEANLAMSMVLAFYKHDWKKAIESIKHTLELNPNLALAHYIYAYLLRIPSRNKEAYIEMVRAKQLDPLNPVYPSDLGWFYVSDRNFDKTIQENLKSLELNPQFPQAYSLLGQAYAFKGMYEEAIEATQKAADLSTDWEWSLAFTYALAGEKDKALELASEIENKNIPWNTYCLAIVYAGLNDRDKVMYWLEQSYNQDHPWILWCGNANTIYFVAYRDDPRFKDLAKRLDLPE
jgi:serine/threonine protein kinase/Flp pilus assembly protein TadD